MIPIKPNIKQANILVLSKPCAAHAILAKNEIDDGAILGGLHVTSSCSKIQN